MYDFFALNSLRTHARLIHSAHAAPLSVPSLIQNTDIPKFTACTRRLLSLTLVPAKQSKQHKKSQANGQSKSSKNKKSTCNSKEKEKPSVRTETKKKGENEREWVKKIVYSFYKLILTFRKNSRILNDGDFSLAHTLNTIHAMND